MQPVTVKPHYSDARRETEVSRALRTHWPEYLIEAAALGIFMISACVFAALLEHPSSPFHQAIESASVRRAVVGAAMGFTAILIFCSPWGQRSGAHMNPAITLSFLTLGKIRPWDSVFYVLAQFGGAILGVGVASVVVGIPLRHSAVNFAATTPGTEGVAPAFLAEFAISALMMTAILVSSNSKYLREWTPFVAGTLVALFVTAESPFSGMSMNPARSLSSALWAHQWHGIWLYFAAPLAGMILAAQLYRLRFGIHRVFCAKIVHGDRQRCIFRCNQAKLKAESWLR